MRNPDRARALVLEPMGMVLELAVDDEIVIEVTADQPPELDDAAAAFTVFVGAGGVLRVTRGDDELYENFGRPVPDLPPSMSTRAFLQLVGLRSPPPTPVAIEPRAVVEQWVERFNAADAIGLAALYHDDAINHQVANAPVVGKADILAMFAGEFAAAKMVCIVEQILQDGAWAILEWKDPLGLRGCGFFQVEDGRIRFQRGYWDKLSFLRMHGLPIE